MVFAVTVQVDDQWQPSAAASGRIADGVPDDAAPRAREEVTGNERTWVRSLAMAGGRSGGASAFPPVKRMTRPTEVAIITATAARARMRGVVGFLALDECTRRFVSVSLRGRYSVEGVDGSLYYGYRYSSISQLSPSPSERIGGLQPAISSPETRLPIGRPCSSPRHACRLRRFRRDRRNRR